MPQCIRSMWIQCPNHCDRTQWLRHLASLSFGLLSQKVSCVQFTPMSFGQKNTCNFEQSQTAHCTLSHAFIQTISYILDYIYINVLYYIILYTKQYTEEVTEDFETLHSPDARSFCRIHCECCHLDFNGTEIWESRCTFAASSLWPRSCSRRVEQCLTRATRATRATRELL